MPFPVSAMPFPMPPLVNIAVKILFQSKRSDNCLSFELAKYNLVIFWLYNTIVFGKLQLPPMPFPIPPLFNTAVKDICAINTFEKLLHILLSEVNC